MREKTEIEKNCKTIIKLRESENDLKLKPSVTSDLAFGFLLLEVLLDIRNLLDRK